MCVWRLHGQPPVSTVKNTGEGGEFSGAADTETLAGDFGTIPVPIRIPAALVSCADPLRPPYDQQDARLLQEFHVSCDVASGPPFLLAEAVEFFAASSA